MNQTKGNAVTNNSSVDFLSLLRDNPDYLMDLSEMVATATKESLDRCGKVKITLGFVITPVLGKKIPQIMATPIEAKMSLPSRDHASKPYYTTEHGQLLRDHPGQLGLFEDDDDPEVGS